MQKLIVGNWKMNPQTGEEAKTLAFGVAQGAAQHTNAKFVLLPPFPFLPIVVDILSGSPVALGAQNCSSYAQGAHTGEISASMLANLSCQYVVIGHSERRAAGEKTECVRTKVYAALEANLTPILCVGEDAAARQSGNAQSVVIEQLLACLPKNIPQEKDIILAYEPIWAIGTGATPTCADITAMHTALRDCASGISRILYGGSVTPDTAQDILCAPQVDGVLVGGASLTSLSFLAIGAATRDIYYTQTPLGRVLKVQSTPL